MRSRLVGVIAMLVACSVGCAGAPRTHVSWPDAPLELRDDADRDQAIDELAAAARGPQRDAARLRIADALTRRLADALDEDKPFVAETLLAQLAELWQDDPATIAAGLRGQAEVLHRARTAFARSGASEPTIATLAILVEIEPDHRAQHLAEIDEVLAYSDDLAIAENGPNAGRAQPIALLQPTVLALPLPWLVDRYVGLLVERNNVIQAVMDRDGATVELIRAHHDIVSTSHRIGNALARAGRAGDIHGVLSRVHGVGNLDRVLITTAEMVAEQPTPSAYIALAKSLRDQEHADKGSAAPDATAALATCLTGLARFPHDPALLAAAADHAQSLGRVAQPIALYEEALRTSGDSDGVDALRLGKLYAEAIARLALGGRPGAAAAAWKDLDRSTRDVVKAHPQPAWSEALAGAETALGRGLIAQGQLRDGEDALESSLSKAPSVDAYETLAQLDLQTDRYAGATRWAARGVALLGDSAGDHYRRAKLERVAGDAFRRDRRVHDAAAHYLDALKTWASLGDCRDLPRSICGERMLESGRMMWWLGEPARAVDLVMHAVDVDSDSPTTPAGAVAFLIEVGRYDDALEAFHRGLGSPEVGELYKVYMSLWLVGEARHRHEAPDRLAAEYLGSRRGEVWYELLAEAATGHAELAQVRAAATTGPRQAELAFYTATLGLDPNAQAQHAELLERVVQARLILDAEYDIARVYLSEASR